MELINHTIDAVCSAFQVEADELLHSRRRHRYLTDARMALCLLLVEQGISRRTVAHTVNRTRANVLNSLRRIADYATYDRTLRAKIDATRQLIVASSKKDFKNIEHRT